MVAKLRLAAAQAALSNAVSGMSPGPRPDGAVRGRTPTTARWMTAVRGLHRVAIACLVLFGLAARAETQPANLTSPLCTNLDDLRDYSSEFPFVDAFKTSRDWVSGRRWTCWDCGGPLDLDQNGWVRSLDASQPDVQPQVANTILFTDLDGAYPGGTYTVLYDGAGTLEYGGSAMRDAGASGPGRDVVQVDPSAGPFLLTIAATNPADYLRNIRVIMPGGVCSNDAFAACGADSPCGTGGTCRPFIENYATQVFHPTFLNNLRRYKSLRFMNWMGTNASPVVEIADYPELDDARWPSAPAEVLASLANRVEADPWITIPHRASDGFVRAFATRLRDGLSPDRRVYVEYSNEVWNSLFPQHLYAATRGCETWADLQAGCDADTNPGNGVNCEGHPWPWNESCADGWRRYYPHRSLEIWAIFANVFGGTDRLVRVMGSQTGQTWLHGQYLSWENAGQQTDVLATAPYFGGSYGRPELAPEVAGWTLDQLFTDLQQNELPATLQSVSDDTSFLQQSFPNLRHVAYEGGQHMVGVFGLENDPALNALFDAANRDPRMGTLYTSYLDGWRAQGGQTFCHFLNVGRWGRYGRWGALENQDQPHATSPKYQALMSFIDDNPCWWPGCAGGADTDPPSPLALSPTAVTVAAGGALVFTPSGGVAPYTFSLAVNNSGAVIDAATGVYTAGALAGLTDRVRVTDSDSPPRTAEAPVDVVAGAPSGVVVRVQPTSSNVGAIVAPPVEVAIHDRFGNLVRSATDPVTVALRNNASGGTLAGTRTRAAVSGVASFGDLSIDRPGQGYKLEATSGMLPPATSAPFDILLAVTNTNDAGSGSLRQAILTSNATPGRQTIRFNIRGTPPFIIRPSDSLPAITDAVVIDGATQPGFVQTPVVQISGSIGHGLTTGLDVQAAGSTIRALAITGYTGTGGFGIRLAGRGGSVVEGCHIGVDTAGVPSSNEVGVVVISAENRIGGKATGRAVSNLISGNFAAGIRIDGPLARKNVVQGNRIGTKVAGTGAAPNFVGVEVSSSGNIIGGTGPGEGNVIAFNTRDGVQILAGVANTVRGNGIFSNGGLGIDLGPDGVTPNDLEDADAGANNLQNFPILAEASSDGAISVIVFSSQPLGSGQLDFYGNTRCDPTGHGEGERFLGSLPIIQYPNDGGTLVGGDIIVGVTLPADALRFVTATATDAAGNTSEFSPCTRVVRQVRITGRVTASGGAPLANMEVGLFHPITGLQVETTHTDAGGNYAFGQLPGGLDFILRPISPDFIFTPSSRTFTNLTTSQSNQDFVGTPQI